MKIKLPILILMVLLLSGCVTGGPRSKLYVSWDNAPRDAIATLGDTTDSGSVKLPKGNVSFTKTPMVGNIFVASAEVVGVEEYSEDEFEFQVVSDSENPYEIEGAQVAFYPEEPGDGYVSVKFRDLEAISPFRIYPAQTISARTNLRRGMFPCFDFELDEANDTGGDIYMQWVFGDDSKTQKVWATYGYAVAPPTDRSLQNSMETDIDFESLEYESGGFLPQVGLTYAIKTAQGYAKIYIIGFEGYPETAYAFAYEYFPNEI